MRAKFFIKTSVNVTETKIDEGAWKKIASYAKRALQKQPPEVSVRKGVPRNFAKLTGKHQCQSLFFGKVESLRPATFLK